MKFSIKTENISGLTLLRCKSLIKIFEVGLIAVQNDFQFFEVDLIAVQRGLALLPCTSVGYLRLSIEVISIFDIKIFGHLYTDLNISVFFRSNDTIMWDDIKGRRRRCLFSNLFA